MNLDNITFLLHEPSHPGNIGSAARAMKTMGLHNLCLVNPKIAPNAESMALASGATDVLEHAHISDDIHAALATTHLVFGTSARNRYQQTPCLTLREAASLIITECNQNKQIAVMFGPERTGLSNQTLRLCHYQINIPASPLYSSINLAQAVQLVAYELYQAHLNGLAPVATRKKAQIPANGEDMTRFFEHLELTLEDLDMLDPKNPKGIMKHMQHLFTRAKPYQQELNLMRGLLKQAQRHTTGRVNVNKASSIAK